MTSFYCFNVCKHFQKGDILHIQRAAPSSWFPDRTVSPSRFSQLLLGDPQGESESLQQLLRLPWGLSSSRGKQTACILMGSSFTLLSALSPPHRETHFVCLLLKEILYDPTRAQNH